MPAVEERFPDHGDPSEWVELTGEEARCLLGLKNYYTRLEDKDEATALERAWADVKKEKIRGSSELTFPRLQNFKWYK